LGIAHAYAPHACAVPDAIISMGYMLAVFLSVSNYRNGLIAMMWLLEELSGLIYQVTSQK
jgi:hypothetical protein